MRIGIIGAGNVGRTLGGRWAEAGHKIIYGVREPEAEKYQELSDRGWNFRGIKVAVRSADIVVLATPWEATEDAINRCGGLAGKVVVDCTNPLKPGLAGLTHRGEDSGGEQVARWATGEKVVKAFNTVGSNIMEQPQLAGGRAVMFICGDEDAKPTVRELSDLLGFETIDAGPLEAARLLEPFAFLWITGAYKLGLGREFAFGLIRRSKN